MFDFMMSSLPDWDDEVAVRNFKEMADSIAEHAMPAVPSGKSRDEYCTERHAKSKGAEYD